MAMTVKRNGSAIGHSLLCDTRVTELSSQQIKLDQFLLFAPYGTRCFNRPNDCELVFGWGLCRAALVISAESPPSPPQV
jgi:hypothetical protein